jgi:transcriptional/translational regulatory protein YebC/TACO1
MIDGGADDVLRDEEGLIVYVPFQASAACIRSWRQLGVEVKSAELKRFPLVTTPGPRYTRAVMKLVDMLEEDEDVNAVYHNMDLRRGGGGVGNG